MVMYTYYSITYYLCCTVIHYFWVVCIEIRTVQLLTGFEAVSVVLEYINTLTFFPYLMIILGIYQKSHQVWKVSKNV